MRRMLAVMAACLALLLVVFGANLGAGVCAQDDAAMASHPLVGSWRFTAPGAPGVPAPDLTLATFTPDGAVVLSGRAVRPALPGSPFKLTYFSTGHGTWQPDGDGSAAFTVVHLASDENGELRAITTVSGILEIAADGDSATGTETFTIAGPDGTVRNAFPVEVTAGSRITLQPMADVGTPPAG